VIAEVHLEWRQLGGNLVEFLGRLCPGVGGGRVGGRERRNDEVLVADDLVELGGLGQLVALQRGERNVRAAHLQTVVVEQLTKPLGVVGEGEVTGEFDSLVTDPLHAGQGRRHVRLGVLADRIKLHPDGDFLPGGADQTRRHCRERGRARGRS